MTDENNKRFTIGTAYQAIIRRQRYKNYLKTKTQEGTESSNAPAESNPLTVTAQVHNTEGDGQIRYFNNLELKCFDLLPSTKTYLCIDNEKI